MRSAPAKRQYPEPCDPSGAATNPARSRPGVILVAVAGLSDGLRKRLRAAGVDTSGPSGQALDPWEVWLRLRAHSGRRATLVDLYELEAARQGIRPEELPAADRQRLKGASLPARRDQAEVLPGSTRGADPHEVTSYDPNWPARFQAWRDRLAAALGSAAVRIDHVGSTSVPGLAAKPIIDVQVSVPEVDDERPYLCRAESAGLVLQLRERGHRFLLPPAAEPRDVHVHICGSGTGDRVAGLRGLAGQRLPDALARVRRKAWQMGALRDRRCWLRPRRRRRPRACPAPRLPNGARAGSAARARTVPAARWPRSSVRTSSPGST